VPPKLLARAGPLFWWPTNDARSQAYITVNDVHGFYGGPQDDVPEIGTRNQGRLDRRQARVRGVLLLRILGLQSWFLLPAGLDPGVRAAG
jgi:hypothetical protein